MKLGLAVLLVATVASAQPGPPAQLRCPEQGTPVLEIVHDKIQGAKVPTSETQIFESGAWKTSGTDVAGKPLAPQHGCLPKLTMDKLRAELQTATWQVTHNHIHCMMVAQTFTTYKVGGKQVWTAKACSSDALDEASTKAIAAIEAELVAAKVITK
jgi:hypothetical protein